MPIHAPTLPPRPEPGRGAPAALVLARFDLRRVLRGRIGMFFLFGLLIAWLASLATLYVKHLQKTAQALQAGKVFLDAVLEQGAAYQAGHLGQGTLTLIWMLSLFVGGGLIARDTLHRVRPLMYAHPLDPRDYLAGKALVAAGLPFALMLPFILAPWGLSLLIAGPGGPVWASLPLRLMPAALIIALLMGTLGLGASALAATPRAGVGWAFGILFGAALPGSILAQVLNQPAWRALSPTDLALAWPALFCGVEEPVLGWVPALFGTLVHLGFWVWIIQRRTRPSEAVL